MLLIYKNIFKDLLIYFYNMAITKKLLKKKPLNKKQLNELLKLQNYEVDKIIETIDDKKGTNYLCSKAKKIKLKTHKFEEPIEHYNYNEIDALDDEDENDDEETKKQKLNELKKRIMTNDTYLEIPIGYFDDRSEFFGLYKIEVKSKKRYKIGLKPEWTMWSDSFPHFSFDIDKIDIPGTKDKLLGKNNPYSYYTMFKKITPFLPSIRFGIYNPRLVTNSNNFKVDIDEEFEVIFYDYVIILTDNEKEKPHILFSLK
jgi:hypothetical protein